jgi:hypothetical protein
VVGRFPAKGVQLRRRRCVPLLAFSSFGLAMGPQDFDSAIPRFESWRPSQHIPLKNLRLFDLAVFLSKVILNAILRVILNICSRRVR